MQDTGGHQFFSTASTHASMQPEPTQAAFAAPSPAQWAPAPASCRELDIAVAEPRKQGDGMGSFVSYKVRSKPLHQIETYGAAPSSALTAEVERRYRDFAWLQQKLQERNKVRA